MVTIHVTNHSKGTKMEGIQSISTTCLANPICQKRKEEPGSVCQRCYAANLCRLRKSLDCRLSANYSALTTHLLTKKEAAAVPVTSRVVRIESFGDVANVTQARNYLRIIKGHPLQRFGIWSKNPGIWLAAFKTEGKPTNCTYVHSSMNVNQPDQLDPRFAKYADHIFTVWDKETYPGVIKKSPRTECAGISCMNCLKCYRKNSSRHINERLR